MATPPGLPDGIDPKPKKPEDFEEPVAWLFGRQFIATFKYVLLYTAFKGKLDSRDWMKPKIIDVEKLWNQSQQNPRDEFWFDYISDTGDGQKAMYSIAYLCMSDLAVKNDLQIGNAVEFVSKDNREELATAGKALLPRGLFLFVGGDTSYHISDYGTLANRFQNPFWWAFQDLHGKASVANKRLIFGIPGNHDYYDSLDGFNRQFRRPSTPDEKLSGQRDPLLMLPTFVRTQEASYIALRLPFDWWFWGLDTENGEIDFRQLEFFKDIRAAHGATKLIVATPEPTIAFGKYADPKSNQSKTFAALELEQPFLKGDLKEQVPTDKCRVDLSGDIHHYARYFGPAPVSGSSNYTSVMAGGGGAFFHPSQTNAGEVPQTVLYPTPGESREKTGERLFRFINIWKGGYVQLFGFLIAFSLFFTAYFPRSGREAVNGFPPFVWLGVSPGVSTQVPERSANGREQLNESIWRSKPLGYYLTAVSVLMSLGLLSAALLRSRKLFKKEYEPTGTKPRKKATRPQRAVVWLLVFAAFVTQALGIGGLRTFDTFLPTYLRSLIIFAALVWAILAVIQSVIYSGWLFEESYSGNIRTWHYWPIWSLLIMAVGQLAASFWFFGKHESSYLMSDLIQLTVILGGLFGLTYFAVGTGGKLKKGIGKFGFILLGISHALLQLTVPFLLVRKGHLLWAPLATWAIVLIYQFIGGALAKLKTGWPLAISWILFGAAVMVTPFVLSSPASLNIPDEFWPTLGLCIYAGVIGAVMSCVFFGSYLGVALAFNGHNNEAGGAARIEGFKHLIRFRLNPKGLTGYVIAIDQAETDGANLKPKIVDVFHICNR